MQRPDRQTDTCADRRRRLGRFRIVLEALALLVAVFTVLRVVLLCRYVGAHNVSPTAIARVLLAGFRFDLLVGFLLLSPLSLHMAVYSNRCVAGRISRLAVHAGLLGAIVLTVLACWTEYFFFDEFQSRFNYIAFEYLAYPTEVLGNIWQSYPVAPSLGGIAAVSAGLYLLLRRRVSPLLRVPLTARRRWGLLAANAAVVAVLWLTSGMGSMQVSPNRVANECAGNGLYTVVYYAWTSRFDYDVFYLTIDPAEACSRVRSLITAAGDRFEAASPNPLDRTVNPPSPRHDWNVVIILEESLGADLVGVLGGSDLTPCFDALCGDGILFDNLYATGNRTARALEAVLASLPPIPGESILKRDHSDHIYTLARLLADRGYQREFIYGGRGIFDGMRSFMLSNGFERFIEQKDYPSPTFVSSWGVCDEDIFHKALDEFDAMQARGRPFFSVVLTVSNHIPFTYPDGRIDRPSGQKKRDSAVKYADWALGDFFRQARSHPFFSSTLFVIMGDHGARVYGAQRLPIKSYRVAALLILPDGQAGGTRCSTLASSLDIAPTIMGAVGGPYRSVFYGRDILHIEPATAYALMQHNNDVAMLGADQQMVVLGCPKTVSCYTLNRSGFLYRLDPDPHVDRDNPKVKETIALYQTAHAMYYNDHCFPVR